MPSLPSACSILVLFGRREGWLILSALSSLLLIALAVRHDPSLPLASAALVALATTSVLYVLALLRYRRRVPNTPAARDAMRDKRIS